MGESKQPGRDEIVRVWDSGAMGIACEAADSNLSIASFSLAGSRNLFQIG